MRDHTPIQEDRIDLYHESWKRNIRRQDEYIVMRDGIAMQDGTEGLRLVVWTVRV